MSDDYEVGYAKPPKVTRFKKGKSGNPKGRPKGSPNVGTAILKAFNEKVVINENGKRRTITKLDASAKQLANKAAQGDLRALGHLLAITELLDERSARAVGLPLEDVDEQVAELIVKRIRQTKEPTKRGSK